MVGVAGLVLTVASSSDSVVSWPGNKVIVYPATLERFASVLLLPSWGWLLLSSWMVVGNPARRRLRARPHVPPVRRSWKHLSKSWKQIEWSLAAFALVVLAVIVVGFVLGAAKGSLRVLPGGAHQVSTMDLNSANWTTVTPGEYNRWAARFIREDAAFGIFGVVMFGYSLGMHNVRRSVRARRRDL